MNTHVQDKARQRSSRADVVGTAGLRTDHRVAASRGYEAAKNAIINHYHELARKMPGTQAKGLAADLVQAFKVAAGDYS